MASIPNETQGTNTGRGHGSVDELQGGSSSGLDGVRRRHGPPSDRHSQPLQSPSRGSVFSLESLLGLLWWLLANVAKYFREALVLLRTFMSSLLPSFGSPRFNEWFEQYFGTVHPLFHHCTFQQALVKAARQQMPLFVFLQSGDATCKAFCQEVLTNHEVVSLINSRFVAWGANWNSPEGFAARRVLKPSGSPHVSVLFTVGAPAIMAAMAGRIELETFKQFLTSGANGVELKYSETTARIEADRRIREEQNIEYQESLERDRRRNELQATQRREAAEREVAERMAAADKAERESNIKSQRKTLAEKFRLGGEIQEFNPAVHIKIRAHLPKGGRPERTFASSDSLASVKEWICCCGELFNDPKFEVPLSFEVSVPFLRGPLEYEKSLDDLGFDKNAILYINETK